MCYPELMPIKKLYSLEVDLSGTMMPMLIDIDETGQLKGLQYTQNLKSVFQEKCLYVSNHYGGSPHIGVRSYHIDYLMINDRPLYYSQEHTVFYTVTITVRKFYSKRDIHVAKLTNARLFDGTTLRTRYEQIPKDGTTCP